MLTLADSFFLLTSCQLYAVLNIFCSHSFAHIMFLAYFQKATIYMFIFRQSRKNKEKREMRQEKKN